MAKEISIPITTVRRRGERLAIAALLIGATAIAFAPIFVRLSQTGPSATAFWPLVLALPVFWVWMAVEGKRADERALPASQGDLRGLAIAGLFFAGDLAFWHESIKYTSVANATLLANFAPTSHLPAAFSSVILLVQPVMSAVFAWLILGKSIGLLQGVGGALVLGGIFLARQASQKYSPQRTPRLTKKGY